MINRLLRCLQYKVEFYLRYIYINEYNKLKWIRIKEYKQESLTNQKGDKQNRPSIG